jgi:hypothetical protein
MSEGGVFLCSASGKSSRCCRRRRSCISLAVGEILPLRSSVSIFSKIEVKAGESGGGSVGIGKGLTLGGGAEAAVSEGAVGIEVVSGVSGVLGKGGGK